MVLFFFLMPITICNWYRYSFFRALLTAVSVIVAIKRCATDELDIFSLTFTYRVTYFQVFYLFVSFLVITFSSFFNPFSSSSFSSSSSGEMDEDDFYHDWRRHRVQVHELGQIFLFFFLSIRCLSFFVFVYVCVNV